MIVGLNKDNSWAGEGFVQKSRYGAKASNLWRMMLQEFDGLEVRIPKGVAISTGAKRWFENEALDWELESEIMSKVRYIEAVDFHVSDKVKAYSVRSGAPVSMPGMMDTILNVGLQQDNLEAFAETYNTTLDSAFEAYWRFLAGYASSVIEIDSNPIEEIIRSSKVFYRGSALKPDNELITQNILDMIANESDHVIPEDRGKIIAECVKAVWRSWDSDRARIYREMNNIDHNMGTGVLIQEMVYGNLNENSATGVAFSHNPNTGDRGLYGDYLVQAQGEDVVGGLYTPLDITKMVNDINLTAAANELDKLVTHIYEFAKEPVDVEVTIQDGKLHLLQWRPAKMSRKATIKSAIDGVTSGLIDSTTATSRIINSMPSAAVQVNEGNLKVIAKGLDEVTEGRTSGLLAIGHDQARAYMEQGETFIFLAQNTSPSDFEFMVASNGLVTVEGGAVCHATLIARNYEKVCIPGCSEIEIAQDNSGFTVDGDFIPAGTMITIDGDSGEVLI